MGFLDMFSKKKEVAKPRLEFPSKSDLEVPPPPPVSEAKDEALGFKQDIEVPPPVAAPDEPAMEFPEPNFEEIEEPNAEDFLPFKDESIEGSEIDAPELPEESIAPVQDLPEITEEVEDVYQVHKRRKPLFVKVDTFKLILSEIRTAKVTLKESENNLARIAEIDSANDKEFDKWHSQLNEVQRRLYK